VTRRLALLGAALLLLILALPLAALLLRSGPAAIASGLAHPLVGPALRVSVVTSAASLGIIVLTGTPLAWLLARGSGRILAALEALVQLPIVVPPAVAGVAMLLAFGRRGLLGAALGGSLAFTPLAVVLAQVFVSAPFYVQAGAIAFRDLDPRLLVVARSLGASPARTFFRVALPLSAPGLAGGAAMAWARALGEFGATLMFAGNLPGRTQTLPLAIYAALEDDVRVAQALSLVLVAAAAALLVVVRRAAPALTRARSRPWP